jgi:hypothetical protein
MELFFIFFQNTTLLFDNKSFSVEKNKININLQAIEFYTATAFTEDKKQQ